jgi:vacuolar-type H+-ATPase subunit E/Vma4
MAIEDIFRALEEQADAEVNEILRVAKAQAKSIEKEAKEEADRIVTSRVAAAEEIVRSRANKSVNAARLEVRRNLASVREAAVDRVFGDAAGRLAEMRGTPQYEAIFTALAKEAFEGVESACELHVIPADKALAEKVAKECAVPCTVVPTLEAIGGLTVTYDEGRIVRQNSFESRLAKVRGLASAKVAEVLTS